MYCILCLIWMEYKRFLLKSCWKHIFTITNYCWLVLFSAKRDKNTLSSSGPACFVNQGVIVHAQICSSLGGNTSGVRCKYTLKVCSHGNLVYTCLVSVLNGFMWALWRITVIPPHTSPCLTVVYNRSAVMERVHTVVCTSAGISWESALLDNAHGEEAMEQISCNFTPGERG